MHINGYKCHESPVVKTLGLSRAMVTHAFNPNIQEAEGDRGRQISEFEASLVYKVSSRTARATQETLSQKNQKEKN